MWFGWNVTCGFNVSGYVWFRSQCCMLFSNVPTVSVKILGFSVFGIGDDVACGL